MTWNQSFTILLMGCFIMLQNWKTNLQSYVLFHHTVKCKPYPLYSTEAVALKEAQLKPCGSMLYHGCFRLQQKMTKEEPFRNFPTSLCAETLLSSRMCSGFMVITWFCYTYTHTHTHTHTRDHPGGELLDFTVQGKINRGWVGTTPSGLASAHLHHPPIFYRPDALPAAQPTVSKHWRQLAHSN